MGSASESDSVDRMVRLGASGKGASHSAYFPPDGRLIIEWYDFGDDAPYESANMLVFEVEQQEQLAGALELPPSERTPTALLSAIKNRFNSYFEVQKFAVGHRIPFTKSVDFMP